LAFAAAVREGGRTQRQRQRDEAESVFKKVVDNYVNGLGRNPGDLMWVAMSAWATEDFHGANDVFKIVTHDNPRNAEAFAAWGDLLAEKYNEPEAIAAMKML